MMAQYTNTAKAFHTKLINPDTTRSTFKRLISDLHRILVKLHNSDLIFNYGEKVAAAKPCDIVRVLSEWSQDDVLDLTIRNLIVDAIVSSENKTVGSGMVCAMALTSMISIDQAKYPRPRGRVEISDLENVIDYFLGDGILSELALKIVNSGGMGASIVFDTTSKNNFVVESTAASKIQGYTHPLFELQNRQIDLSYVVCLDGIIESLGEIDNILQHAAEQKCQIIICARGYHPDVVNTLNQNAKEGRLNVIPFVVRRWDHDNDDAVTVCNRLGLQCISRDRGEALNTKSLDDFSIVNNVYIATQYLTIQSLVGASLHMCIRVPKRMQSILGIIEDRIRITIQACISVSRSGHLRLDNTDIDNVWPSVSYDALCIGLKSAQSSIKNIDTLGYMIIPDTN